MAFPFFTCLSSDFPTLVHLDTTERPRHRPDRWSRRFPRHARPEDVPGWLEPFLAPCRGWRSRSNVCVCVSVCVFLYLCIFCILGAATNFLILATYKLSKYEITVSLKAMFFWVRKRVTRLIGWKMLINELPGMHIQLLLKDEKITSNTCDQNESKKRLALFCLVFNSFETTWAWISAASVFPDSFEGAARLQCVFHRSVPTGAPVQIFRTVQMHGHGYQLDVHHS